MGAIEQTSVILEDHSDGPKGKFSTPDGIPPGWTVGYVAGEGWVLRKIPPKPHWTTKLALWPSKRPSTINSLIDFGDRVVFITDGGGRRILGVPFSFVEALYNEVSRV